MKTLTIILSMLTLLTYNSFSQNVDAKGLLDKPETRTEIFNTIVGDHALFMEFTKVMKGNEHAMMMMQNETNKMGEMKAKTGMVEMKGNDQMMSHKNMMEMMKENPEMMQQMMGNMMKMCEKDSVMRCNMADMMAQHPEMMKTMKQKMNEKGMIKTDSMPMMHNQGDEKDQLHKH
jgi:hypothetical protein